jgi:hypothetical protein
VPLKALFQSSLGQKVLQKVENVSHFSLKLFRKLNSEKKIPLAIGSIAVINRIDRTTSMTVSICDLLCAKSSTSFGNAFSLNQTKNLFSFRPNRRLHRAFRYNP